MDDCGQSSASDSWAHEVSGSLAGPGIVVHLTVAVLFVWLATTVYFDCEDFRSAQYDHVRLCGLQAYRDLYLDRDGGTGPGPGLARVLGDAVVRVFGILFALCSLVRRFVWTVLRTSYSLISVATRSFNRVVMRTSRSISNGARKVVRPVVGPVRSVSQAVLSVAQAILSIPQAIRSIYNAVRVFLNSAIIIAVAASFMALICVVPILESGVSCSCRLVCCLLSFALKTVPCRVATKTREAHKMVRSRCDRAARRGSLLVDGGVQVASQIVRGMYSWSSMHIRC